MLDSQKTYLMAALTACAVSILLTPQVIRLARRLGVVDQPGYRKVHSQATPLLGGLAVAGGVWAAVGLTWLRSNLVTETFWEDGRRVFLVLASSAIMLLLGVLDDRLKINARVKLLVQLPVAVVLVTAGMQFEVLWLPVAGVIELGPWAPMVTVLWLVGVTNALNLIDGMDGVATGVAFLAATTTAIIAAMGGNVMAALLMSALAGACLGFLPYNFSSACVFLGDSGSLFLGMTLAATSVLTSQKSVVAGSMLIPVIVLGFPIFDTLLAMVRRAVRGKSMFSPDAGHVHHRLLAKGLSQQQATLAIYFVCGLLALTALAAVTRYGPALLIMAVMLIMVLAVGIWRLGYFDSVKFGMCANNRQRVKALCHHAEAAKCLIGVAQNSEQVFEALRSLCHNCGSGGLILEIRNGVPDHVTRYEWRRPGQEKTEADGPSVETRDFPEEGIRVQTLMDGQGLHEEIRKETGVLLGAVVEAAARKLHQLSIAPEALSRDHVGHGHGRPVLPGLAES